MLVFTKAASFRHDSIPAAVQAVRELGAQASFGVDATEDAAAFTDESLARYDAVVFLLTSGDVLPAAQQAALQRYIRRGGGFVGVHSASDTEHGWPWYLGLVGAEFQNHPSVQQAIVDVVDRKHPSTAALPRRWTRTDEWYNFARTPRGSVTVLATLDETSYSPGEGAMGRDHPIAWAHAYDGGRAWYTAGGHSAEPYSEPLFRAHLLGGIRWAAGFAPPRIDTVSLTVRARKLSVDARYSDCRACRGEVRVKLPSRTVTVLARARAGRAQATTPALPPGRWVVTIALQSRETALRAVSRRSITVR